MKSGMRRGSPPRVRGKRQVRRGVHREGRITPACAGKTVAMRSAFVGCTDHPRVCGENRLYQRQIVRNDGSPPRVRGKQRMEGHILQSGRITPACAGKTALPCICISAHSDHPRVCGENFFNSPLWYSIIGSPPRVRGKPSFQPDRHPRRRITPACAGKTAIESSTSRLSADHPRVCGENSSPTVPTVATSGSPPRVRGKQFPASLCTSLPRITPACAGKTSPPPLVS